MRLKVKAMRNSVDQHNQELMARYGQLISVCVPCSEIDPLAFLNHAKGQTRFLWSSPDDSHVIAGFGTAVTLEAWGANRIDDIEAQAEALYTHLQQPNRSLPTPKLLVVLPSMMNLHLKMLGQVLHQHSLCYRTISLK